MNYKAEYADNIEVNGHTEGFVESYTEGYEDGLSR